jgi:hypothetical protein
MRRIRKALIGATIAGATITGGAIALIGVASAQTGTTDTTSATTESPAAAAPTHDPSKGGHTANGITEEVLTGDQATQATAAAEAAVPGGTIERVETDAEGAAFEAHVVKADGSHVTVKLNADFSVASIEAGMR